MNLKLENPYANNSKGQDRNEKKDKWWNYYLKLKDCKYNFVVTKIFLQEPLVVDHVVNYNVKRSIFYRHVPYIHIISGTACYGITILTLSLQHNAKM